jgi:hypothetical protein
MDIVKREPDSRDEASPAPSDSYNDFVDVKSEVMKCEPEVSFLRCLFFCTML